MNENRYCVIMCGGIGSRFWPYSREQYPKQFIDFMGTGRSLLQMTFDRLRGVVPEQNVVIVANKAYEALIREQLPFVAPSHLLLEPARRNTAPCIAWAINHIRAINPDASVMVSPSDHLITLEDAFRRSVERSFDFVETHDALLTLGIKPSRPETGYGYIQKGNAIDADFSAVKTFTEKPDLELAKIFLASGEFVWNSGIFFWSVKSIGDALATYAPEVTGVLDQGREFYGTDREMEFINRYFPECQAISIDYAVMEKAKNVYVQSVDIGWSDLGTWGSLYENSPKADDDLNVGRNCDTRFYNSHRNMVMCKDHKLVMAVGLDDYIVADTDDVLLICPKSEEQHLKHFTHDLKAAYGDKYN